MKLDNRNLHEILRLLAAHLDLAGIQKMELIVCGGSSLIATDLITRTTKDVDIIALRAADGRLLDPDPLPDFLVKAAAQVARDMGLEENWLNNGPSRGDGGLFRMGFPNGLADRLQSRTYGPRLTVHFISRLDQIHFKLYAAVDQGGYHMQDLMVLKPTAEEIERAAQWTITHDISENFRMLLRELLRKLGYEFVANRI